MRSKPGDDFRSIQTVVDLDCGRQLPLEALDVLDTSSGRGVLVFEVNDAVLEHLLLANQSCVT